MSTGSILEVDLAELAAFRDEIIASVAAEHPHLIDPTEGEHLSNEPDGRLTPEILEIRREVRRRAVEAGYWGGFMPAEAGGAGWSETTAVAVYETLANAPAYPSIFWPDFAIHIAGQAWGPTRVLLHGARGIRERFLAPLMTGELTSCTAITDPLAGSDPHNMYATAERREHTYRISGVKQYVGNAPYADLALFYARTSGNRGDRDGISLIVVERDRPGFAITRIFPVMDGRGNHGEITLDACEVPADNIVGEEGQGFAYLMQFISASRLMLAATSLGAAQWCLDQAVARVCTRKTFGIRLADRQGIQWMLADVATEIVTLRGLVREAARILDAGGTARMETAMAKWVGPNIYGRAADLAMQVHGGLGMLNDTTLERHYRRARQIRVYMGTDEMQRNTIAKQLLRGR